MEHLKGCLLFLGTNSLLALIIARIFFSLYRRERTQAITWAWLTFITTFFLPVLGLLGIVFLHQNLKNHTIAFPEKLDKLFKEHLNKDIIPETNGLIPLNVEEIKELEPLSDTLQEEDIELKKGAIDALEGKADRTAVKIMKNSLDNADSDIRYFLVDSLSKLGKSYSDRILNYLKIPENDRYSMENAGKIANACYQYAVSGIESNAISLYYFQLAVDYYSLVYPHCKSGTIAQQYADSLKRIGNYDKASAILEDQVARNGPDTENILNLCDIYFRLGKIDRIRILLDKVPSSVNSREPLNGLIKFWTEAS